MPREAAAGAAEAARVALEHEENQQAGGEMPGRCATSGPAVRPCCLAPPPLVAPPHPASDLAPSSGCSPTGLQGVPQLAPGGVLAPLPLSGLYFLSPKGVYAPSADRGSGRSGRMRPAAPPQACRGHGRDAVGHGFLSHTPDFKMGKRRPGEFLFMFFILLDELSIKVSIPWGTYCGDRYITYSLGAGKIKMLIPIKRFRTVAATMSVFTISFFTS